MVVERGGTELHQCTGKHQGLEAEKKRHTEEGCSILEREEKVAQGYFRTPEA